MHDTALKDLKADAGALRQAYSDAGGKLNSHDSDHNPCPFCGDDSGFSLFEHEGLARWKCHSKCGGGGGTIVDFVMAWQKCDSRGAIKLALEKYGGVVGASGAAPVAPAPRKEGKLHLTVDDAIAANVWRLTHDPKNSAVKATKYWQYTDAKGLPLFVAARYDFIRKTDAHPDGEPKKEFSPIRREGNGWRLGLGPWGKTQKCPLYRRKELQPRVDAGMAATTPAQTAELHESLHVAEGEKCADALAALGLMATTSQGGSGRATESDWTPAAVFERVIVWQDIDPAPPADSKDARTVGEKYAQTVAACIHAAATAAKLPLPKISIVDLRAVGLVEGQDVYDFIQALMVDGKDPAAISATLAAVAKDFGHTWFAELADIGLHPGQPTPISPDPQGRDARKIITNFELCNCTRKNRKGEEESVPVPKALPIDVIRKQIQDVCEGWPIRLRSPGSRNALLFIDEGEAAKDLQSAMEASDTEFSRIMPGPLVPHRVRWMQTVADLRCWLHQRATLKFQQDLDMWATNFCAFGDVYADFGSARAVREYFAAEVRPHWPRMPGHYYAWSAPANYRADGKMLRKLLSFFDNDADFSSKAVTAAAVLTPFWGGPYKERPAFAITAPDRGYGKTTRAEVIAKLAAGHLAINLASRDEDELMQRLLTPDAMTKRVGLIDNVKGTLSSSLLEGLITTDIISGKRLYSGEATRPNTMTYFITGNGMRLSRDMSLRVYFIELTKPRYWPAWNEELAQFVALHGCEVIADIGWVLSQPVKLAKTRHDRWALWGREVLARACEFVGGILPDQVMERTACLREECDDDAEEARLVFNGVLEQIATERKLAYKSYDQYTRTETMVFSDPTEELFITSTEMVALWAKVTGGKLKAKQIKSILCEHMEAGRMPGLQWQRKSQANGYVVNQKAMVDYLNERRKEVGLTLSTAGLEAANV